MTFEEYVTLNESVEVCGDLSVQDILSEVLNKMSADIDIERKEEVEAEEMSIPISSEVPASSSEHISMVH